MTYPLKALVVHPAHPAAKMSRWFPHQGKREMARRVRQAAK